MAGPERPILRRYPAQVPRASRPQAALAGVLARAARAVHTEADRERVVSWVAEAATMLSGADVGGVWVLGDEDGRWTTAPPPPSPAAALMAELGDPRRQPALHPAVRGGSTVRLDDARSGDRGNAGLAERLPGMASILAVPVLASESVPHGVLLVASPDTKRFSEDVEWALSALAAHLGVALENLARRHALEQLRATEQQMVNELQAAVMPARPDVAFTELGAYYSPADPEIHTGGDLHDWIVLPDGDLHLAVVDVMGKGVAATKDALAVTHALRLLAIDECPLDQLVTRADTIVTAQNPDLVATLMVGRYRPSTGTLRLAGAGHPPALLVREGNARQLMAAGVPIGWPGAGSDALVEIKLDRADTVILYTDGLVEGTKDIVEGLASLERFAEETAPYPAEQQARILVERTLRGAARRDDSLALILRRRMPAATAARPVLGPFEHHLSRSMAAVSVGRGLLREWLTRVPVDPDPTHDLLLVATELCANAVEHATWEAGGVVLRAHTDGTDVVLEVEDDGEGLSWPHLDSHPPDPVAEQGRGLWLVHTFSDEVNPYTVDRRNVVRCVKRAVVNAG